MDVLVWNSWFETCLDQIDAQHQQLVEIIKALSICGMGSPDCRENFPSQTQALFNYAHQYFADEEQLMAEYGADSGKSIGLGLSLSQDIVKNTGNTSMSAAKPAREPASKFCNTLNKWGNSHDKLELSTRRS